MSNSSKADVVDFKKKCYSCGSVKLLTDFAKKRNAWDTRCKVCKSSKQRKLRRRRNTDTRKTLFVTEVVDVPVCVTSEERMKRRGIIEGILSDLVLEVLTETQECVRS